jgi:hypothetical protein
MKGAKGFLSLPDHIDWPGMERYVHLDLWPGHPFAISEFSPQ